MGRGGESPRYGQRWIQFFYWGVDDREKKGVSMFLPLE